MTPPHAKREIVIEFEKVQIIRKRARTTYAYCRGCGGNKDFVTTSAAAELFDIALAELGSFVSANSVHTSAGTGGAGICVASLLEAMQSQQNRRELKLLVSKNRAIS